MMYKIFLFNLFLLEIKIDLIDRFIIIYFYDLSTIIWYFSMNLKFNKKFDILYKSSNKKSKFVLMD